MEVQKIDLNPISICKLVGKANFMAAGMKSRSLGSSLRDLLILVIGIVLSFFLTEWRQKKSNFEEEKRIVTLLHSDLQKDTADIHIKLEGLKDLKRGYDSILSYRSDAENADPLKVLSWAYSVVNILPFEPKRTGFIQLNNHKNSGALKNKEVLTAVIGLHNEEYSTLKTLNLTHKDMLINQMMPKYYSWIPFIASPKDITEEAETKLLDLLSNNEFLNMLQFEYILKVNLENYYEHALSRIDSTMKLIEAEYPDGLDIAVVAEETE